MAIAAQAAFYALAVYIATAHGDTGDVPAPSKLSSEQIARVRGQAEFVGKATRSAHAMFVKLERAFKPGGSSSTKQDPAHETVMDVDAMLPDEKTMLEVMTKAPTIAAGVAALRHVFCQVAAEQLVLREVEIANLRGTLEVLTEQPAHER
ncbi:hypothetical protein EKK58_05315 [Candidatus Dependentiae bacterium]|nr:MAG: hypothetical protein EKK58_05315 [Candidatus Dependentiae bacterium]